MLQTLQANATTITQAVVLVLGLLAGQLWPREARSSFLTKESWVNLLNGLVLFPLRLLIGLTGINALDVGLLDLTGLPAAAQWLIAFLALDFVRYWVHYADHRVPWLWTFHRVHHSAEALEIGRAHV